MWIFFDVDLVACFNFALLKSAINWYLPPVSSVAYMFWLCIKLGCCRTTSWNVHWSKKLFQWLEISGPVNLGCLTLESIEECIIIHLGNFVIISLFHWTELPSSLCSLAVYRKQYLYGLYQYRTCRFEHQMHLSGCLQGAKLLELCL